MGVAGSNRHNQRSRRKSATSGRNGAAARSSARKLTFTIPSDIAATRDVHKSIMDVVETHRYDEQSTFAIRLALEEGLMNAIKHGNRLNPKKTVHVEAKVNSKSADITIEDQGEGFCRCDVPDPCATENLLKCSGRGILLMEAYMDKVEYSKGGRRVRMVKKNP